MHGRLVRVVGPWFYLGMLGPADAHSTRKFHGFANPSGRIDGPGQPEGYATGMTGPVQYLRPHAIPSDFFDPPASLRGSPGRRRHLSYSFAPGFAATVCLRPSRAVPVANWMMAWRGTMDILRKPWTRVYHGMVLGTRQDVVIPRPAAYA